MMVAARHIKSMEAFDRKLRLCLGSKLCRGLFIEPSAKKILPSAALSTAILTALQPLPRVGPSAGWDHRHNQVFAEGQPSARSAPSEKERALSHLGCRPLCQRLCRRAVGTNAICAERPSPALGKGIEQGLPRLTGLCREPAGAIGRAHVCADGPPSAHAPLPRAPPGSRQRIIFFGMISWKSP
jgi:hypothetical protein